NELPIAPETQYSMMFVSSSSLEKLASMSPPLSLQVWNFSTIHAANPTGESVSPNASVWGFVPWPSSLSLPATNVLTQPEMSVAPDRRPQVAAHRAAAAAD